jgi:hypothetical protein
MIATRIKDLVSRLLLPAGLTVLVAHPPHPGHEAEVGAGLILVLASFVIGRCRRCRK